MNTGSSVLPGCSRNFGRLHEACGIDLLEQSAFGSQPFEQALIPQARVSRECAAAPTRTAGLR